MAATDTVTEASPLTSQEMTDRVMNGVTRQGAPTIDAEQWRQQHTSLKDLKDLPESPAPVAASSPTPETVSPKSPTNPRGRVYLPSDHLASSPQQIRPIGNVHEQLYVGGRNSNLIGRLFGRLFGKR